CTRKRWAGWTGGIESRTAAHRNADRNHRLEEEALVDDHRGEEQREVVDRISEETASGGMGRLTKQAIRIVDKDRTQDDGRDQGEPAHPPRREPRRAQK